MRKGAENAKMQNASNEKEFEKCEVLRELSCYLAQKKQTTLREFATRYETLQK